MAITNISLALPSGISQYTDTAMGNSADAVKASSTTLYSMIVDNSANGGAASYVKLYNAASGGVTVGTTVPDVVVYAPAGAIINIPFFTSAQPGLTFATALTAACVTAGGTAGTTSPSSSVKVTINYA